MLAFAAADRAEVVASRRDFDETRVSVSLSRRARLESGTAAARRNANTDERGGTR
jgi:hypothetical protein